MSVADNTEDHEDEGSEFKDSAVHNCHLAAKIVAMHFWNSIWFIALSTALVVAMMLWIVFGWLRTHYTFSQAVLYSINTLFTRLLWRTKVSGPLPFQPGRGAIVVANHTSGIDPLLIQTATNRVVHWMVAREYVEHWSMGWAFRILQVIPVGRAGIDTAATKQALRYATGGECVGMFPEGRINETKGEKFLLPGRLGAALVAIKAQVPVIPCYISGAPYNGTALGSFLMPARARVVVGEPIDTSPWQGRENDREAQEELTKLLLTEIARLAGIESFEPEITGRKRNLEEESQPVSE